MPTECPDIVVTAGVNGNSQIVVSNGVDALTGSANPTTISFVLCLSHAQRTRRRRIRLTAQAPVRITLKKASWATAGMEIFTSQGTGRSRQRWSQYPLAIHG